MKRLTLNLNFFTGKIPEWLRFHPHLLDWFPEVLIFNQQEMGQDSKGTPVKFSDEPSSLHTTSMLILYTNRNMKWKEKTKH